MGDLDELTGPDDKLANNKGNFTRYNKFMKIFNKNNLVDIRYFGLSYTWWNNRRHLDAVFERLDIVVANPHWLILYKDARVGNLSIVGSDHGLILLTMDC